MQQPNPSRHTIEDLEARGAQARKDATYSSVQSRYSRALILSFRSLLSSISLNGIPLITGTNRSQTRNPLKAVPGITGLITVLSRSLVGASFAMLRSRAPRTIPYEDTRDETIDNVNTIALCIGLAERTAESWIMRFAPFPFLPQTRRASVTEIVVRKIVKLQKLFSPLKSG